MISFSIVQLSHFFLNFSMLSHLRGGREVSVNGHGGLKGWGVGIGPPLQLPVVSGSCYCSGSVHCNVKGINNDIHNFIYCTCSNIARFIMMKKQNPL